jgi:hypothetical protein
MRPAAHSWTRFLKNTKTLKAFLKTQEWRKVCFHYFIDAWKAHSSWNMRYPVCSSVSCALDPVLETGPSICFFWFENLCSSMSLSGQALLASYLHLYLDLCVIAMKLRLRTFFCSWAKKKASRRHNPAWCRTSALFEPCHADGWGDFTTEATCVLRVPLLTHGSRSTYGGNGRCITLLVVARVL